MYHLRIFNVDAGGRPIGIVQIGESYNSAPEALADAARLRARNTFPDHELRRPDRVGRQFAGPE